MKIAGLGGKGIVYDLNGVPILSDDESILAVMQNKNTCVWPGWRKRWIGGKVPFSSEPGNGTLYLTDRRIVFTRKPDPWSAGEGLMIPATFALGVGEVLRTRHIVKHGGYEFLEICLDDIAFYRRWNGHVWLLLRLNGRPYRSEIPYELLNLLLPVFKQRGILMKK
jgi:hypothetical protein